MLLTKREIAPLHELSKVEKKLAFLYTLSTLNIPNAQESANIIWTKYMMMLADLSR